MLRPAPVIVALWIAFGISWLLAAGWSSAVDKRVGLMRELPYRVLMLAGAGLLAVPAHGYHGPLRLWQVNLTQAWLCVAAMVLGFAFAWWGRIHLGELWSAQVTAKANHRVIDTGPYGLVRHPIYTGILLSVYATAAAKGTVLGLAGALVITLGIWMKAHLEESWLANQLEPDAYQRYRRSVPMLLPFGPRST
jgi:protein-S-isoprenylcysteine O-methyltransferase Ste14